MSDKDRLVSLLQSAGYDAIEYRGRGSYNKPCTAVVVDDPFNLCADLMMSAKESDIENAPEELGECNRVDHELNWLGQTLRHTVTDNMGSQTIVYWPSVLWAS